jgi:hypothetical protein
MVKILLMAKEEGIYYIAVGTCEDRARFSARRAATQQLQTKARRLDGVVQPSNNGRARVMAAA